MKNIFIQTIACIMFGFLSATSFANSISATTSGNSVIIDVANESASTVEIQLVDKFQQLLVNEVVEKSNYKAEFDLKFLPKGVYKLTVKSSSKDAIEFTNYNVKITDNTVLISEPKSEKIVKPELNFDHEMLVVSMISLNRSTPVSVYFIDAQNNLVNHDHFSVTNGKVKKYDVSKLPAGQYLANFYFQGELVQKSFTVQ